MYRNSKRIFTDLKRIIFILFLAIYIIGCGVSTKKYIECENLNSNLHKEVKTEKEKLETCNKNNINLEIDREELLSIVDFHLRSISELKEKIEKQEIEIKDLKKSNFLLKKSDVFFISEQGLNLIKDIMLLFHSKYGLIPSQILSVLEGQYSNIMIDYYIENIKTQISISTNSNSLVLVELKKESSNDINSKNIRSIEELNDFIFPILKK